MAWVEQSLQLVLDLPEATGTPADGPQDVMRRRCQLSDGTPVPRSTAERLATLDVPTG